MQPIRRYGFDAAILFSDILVIPDALGQSVEFADGEGPKLAPVRDSAALAGLSERHFHKHLAPVYETISRLSQDLPPHVALIGFCGAPWTVATYMVEGGSSRDFAMTRGWSIADPEGFGQLIDIITRATGEYLCRQIESGAEIVQIFDSWAGILPDDAFQRWVIAPTARIVSAVKERFPDVPIIGFPRGAGPLYMRYIGQTGVDAVGLDTTVPLDWAADQLQPRVIVQGNLDPQVLLAGGTAMEERAAAIVSAFSGGPFIFNLGHGIIKETPPEHVGRLVDVIRGEGKA